MEHQLKATAKTPALAIFLLDVSASMGLLLDGKPRVDVVKDALQSVFRRMVYLSTKGGRVSSRYHLAIYAYTDQVYDLLDGIKPIDKVAALGAPKLAAQMNTDTALGFLKVEELLKAKLSEYMACPAPVVCHLTDGEYNGDDPEPIVRRIMNMRVTDGPVLVENIFISDLILKTPITDTRQWTGITPDTPLASKYANKLRDLSSPLPEAYRVMMGEMGYAIRAGSVMLLPGTTPELVSMAFAMATTTR